MSAPWDDGSDNEEGDIRHPEYGGYDATIFLVEATKLMFDMDLGDECYFAKCIECCKAFMLQQIRASKKDPTAIILFGTKKGTDSWSNVSVLQNLSQPSADRVKQLMKMLESKDFEKFENKYGHSNDFSVANALWLCHQLLSGYKLKLSAKHIIMMTCTPDPHAHDLDKQKQAKNRASSLSDASVMLNVVPLGSTFDKKAFYSDLVQIVNGQNDDELTGIEEPSQNVDQILHKINLCGSQKRSTGRIMWHLGNGVKLSVGVYNLVQPRTVPPRKRLFRQTNEEVEVKQQMFHVETGEVVFSVKEKRVVRYAGRSISFDADEWKRAKLLSKNGIKLLGFKPKSCVKYFVQKAAFVYPDETLVGGSRTLFAALHERCLKRGVVPICLFVPRKISRPKLVALWPQMEKRDEKGVQISAPGFLAIYLPYENYIRDLSAYYHKTIPNPELVDVARAMVVRLNHDYNPFAIKNPKVERHWANIEAIALGLEDTETVKDGTLPDNEKIRDDLGDLAREFIDLGLGSDFDAESIRKQSSKRTQPSAEKAAKKPKMDVNSEDMKCIAQNHQVNLLTVSDLKKYLKSEGVHFSSQAKKADLVQLVYDHFEMDG